MPKVLGIRTFLFLFLAYTKNVQNTSSKMPVCFFAPSLMMRVGIYSQTWEQMMLLNKIVPQSSEADQSALGTVNRPLPKGGRRMQIRRFSPDLKTKISGNHPGLYGVPIQFWRGQIPTEKLEDFARRTNGMPLLLDAELQVEAMYFDPHASIEEHAADHSVLFLVIHGQGTVRIGGPMGETREIRAGDAVLWPAHVDHTVWTEDDELHAIVINVFQDHSSH